MYRQSPSRNQRSRGVKAKHILQICLLLAICVWLIYQVKHSHDKRKEFEESDGRILVQGESGDDLIKLGRKDIQARMEGTVSKNKKHEESEEEEEEEGGREDIEENNIEEDGREDVEENKIEDDEMESKKVEGGDDEIDEHELENFHEEVDGEEDLVIEENGREEGVENGSQETDLKDARGEVTEKELSVVEGNRDRDDSSSVDEAREEHYRADDASSAVTHDAQRNENQHSEKPKQILGDIEMVRGEVAGDDLGSNMLNSSGNGSLPISTATEELDASSSTTLVNQNVTESKPELHLLTSGSKSDTSDPVVISRHLDSNSTRSPMESYNNNTESSEVVRTKKKNEIYENLETRNRDVERDAIDISDTANF